MAPNRCEFYYEIKLGYIERIPPICEETNRIANAKKRNAECELREILAISNSLEKETEDIMQKITDARDIVKKNILIMQNNDNNVKNSKRLIATYQDKYNKAVEVSNRSNGIVKAKNNEIKSLWEQYRVKVKIMDMLEVKALHSYEENVSCRNSKKTKLEE